MPHYWLKYKISSRGSVGKWEWQPLGIFKSKKEVTGVDDLVEEIRDRECWGESHKMVWTVEDWAPSRVISGLLQDAEERSREYQLQASVYSMLLSTGEGRECPQCGTAEAWQYSAGKAADRRARSCPTCGRNIFEDTLPYLLPPEEIKALKLLGSLVEGGSQSDKSWPAWARKHTEDGISPLQWLIDLGLAGGSASSATNFKTIWQATEKGKAEWERRKHLLQSKTTSGKKD